MSIIHQINSILFDLTVPYLNQYLFLRNLNTQS